MYHKKTQYWKHYKQSYHIRDLEEEYKMNYTLSWSSQVQKTLQELTLDNKWFSDSAIYQTLDLLYRIDITWVFL